MTAAADTAKAAEFRNAIRPPMDLTDRAVPVKRAPQTDSHQLL